MPPPPPLFDDIMAEIFLRLPPDEPEHLFRAALVCKPWLRILCDPGFLRRYRALHGAPPILGLLHRLQNLGGCSPPRFASTTLMPDFPHPGSEGGRTCPLDCRHGRVLIYMAEDENVDYLVWDPVTGDGHAVPMPDTEPWLIESAAVLCATHGCDHLDYHGGPFRVVFMATPWHRTIFAYVYSSETIFACVYSSETGAWSQPISLDKSSDYYAQRMQEGLAVRYTYSPYLQPRRGTHIGDGIYNTIRLDNTIVKYDFCKNRLSLIRPPSKDVYYIALMALDNNALGFASVLGSSLEMWSMKMDTEEVLEWLPYRIIELEKIIPVANPVHGTVFCLSNIRETVVVGSAEGVGVNFVSTHVGLFSIELKSERVKKVDEPGVYFSVLPYMRFYTPGIMLALACCLLHFLYSFLMFA